MKKLFTLLFLSFSLLQMMAQPTITSDIMFAIGDSAPVQYFDQGQGVFDAGPAGANVTWDFSAVNTNPNMAFTWRAELPSQTAWAADFPNATHAFRFPQDSGLNYLYYQYDGNKVELLGTINAAFYPEFNRTLLFTTLTKTPNSTCGFRFPIRRLLRTLPRAWQL